MAGRVYLVHGFNSNGAKWDEVVEALRAHGHDAEDFDYGWRFLLTVWFASRVAARGLASVSRPGDIAVGYSNGCSVVMQALEDGAKFDRVILIAPALKSDFRKRLGRRWRFPLTLRRVDVLSDRRDWIVELARWVLFFTPWGNMGRVGATWTPEHMPPAVHNWKHEERSRGRAPWHAHVTWGRAPDALAAQLNTLIRRKSP